MKNEENAKDVLQEAYIKAFSKLDTLKQPEAFPGWLGQIVANTAKNMLGKKNPMLFSDVAVDEEDEQFEYQIEDDSIENQPELSYTRQETQELVHEMIDTLSEEQRMCILMFHIEGASISEIAQTLGCSENTVKSRLNYGRKNLKTKAEELQKKGYKLYSVVPLPFFLALLRRQEAYWSADRILSTGGNIVAEKVFSAVGGLGTDVSDISPGAREILDGQEISGVQETTAVHGAAQPGTMGTAVKTAQAVKTGFIHTVAGKVTAAVVGICIVGGAAVYGVSQMTAKEEAPKTETVSETKTKEPDKADKESEQPSNVKKEVKEEDYPSLIAGNLTEEELEYVLAYGPQEIPLKSLNSEDYKMILNILCEPSHRTGGYIEEYGTTANYKHQYSLKDVNRMFASFSTWQYTKEHDEGTEYGIDVDEDGDKIAFVPATVSYVVSASINSADYTDKTMEIYYTYDYTYAEAGRKGYTVEKKAVLEPTEEGLYRIVKIEEVGSRSERGGESQTQPQTSSQEKTQTEEKKKSSEFPAGSYGYTATAGGLRAGLTIDASGAAKLTMLLSGTGEQETDTYQLSVDNTVTVPDGVTAYLMTSTTGGDNRAVSYDFNTGILTDITGQFEWTKGD